MYLSISENGAVSLQDHENFTAFSITASSMDAAHSALGRIATPAEDNHFWLDCAAVMALSPACSDPHWIEAYNAMLEAVQPYGYFDPELRRVKAHVETAR